LRIVVALVYPVIPESAGKIWNQLGLGEISRFDLPELKWGQLPLGGKLGKIEPVFPRADKSAIERMHQMEQTKELATPSESAPADAGTTAKAVEVAASAVQAPAQAAPQAGTPAAAAAATQNGRITIDDFLKVEMRVGQVKVAERVKGADKLLRLEVDIGTEVRQVVAGIAMSYAPEMLIGRKVVIVANLQPRKLRGLESNGMIVAASVGENGSPVLAGFLEDVPIGAKLK